MSSDKVIASIAQWKTNRSYC